MTIRHYNVFMAGAQESLLYSRVETVLAGEISNGDLRVGDQLPTEDSLIARFGVSRITVRRAIQNLVSRGLVEIRRGKGTFVAAPKITQDLTELSADLCGGYARPWTQADSPRDRQRNRDCRCDRWPASTRADEGRARRPEFVACAWRTAFPLSFDEDLPSPWRSARRSSLKQPEGHEPELSRSLERKYDVPLLEAEY